ncbi:DUF4883 family protein [Clostridium perfringens]|uniref:DUF4883 family protein n=3 Tax=Clostridium perfringens TaxID=1502 RepID=UPI002FE43573
MMKKITKIFLITLCFSLILISCSKINIPSKEKPSLNYHTKNLSELVSKNNIKIRVLDMNIYSEVIVDNEDVRIIDDLLKSLKDSNFINEEPLPNKPLYKNFIDLNSEKYVIDIYGDDLITLYPWDSDVRKDYLSLKDIPNSFKLEPFCQYVFNKKQ